MQCPQCQQDNPPQAKFCLECGTRLVLMCAQCDTGPPPGAKFCLECGQPVGARPAMPSQFAVPEAYTPRHLAEKILTARSDLEGECKQVTVLFADIKGSTELTGPFSPRFSPRLPGTSTPSPLAGEGGDGGEKHGLGTPPACTPTLTLPHLRGREKTDRRRSRKLNDPAELIEGLDPEEARRLLDPALHAMMDAVHRYEGTVHQVLGDGRSRHVPNSLSP